VTAVWWRRNQRSGPERYDFWTRASLYALLAAEPLLALALARAQQHVRVPGLVVFLLLAAAQAATCVALLRASLSFYLARGPRPKRWLVAVAIALTPAGLLAGAAAFPAFTPIPAGQTPVSAWVAMLFGGPLTAALTPLLNLPALFGVVLAGAAAVGAWPASTGGAGSSGPAFAGGFQYLLYIGVVALTYRISAWTLRIMWELDRSRAAHARLAVAEERLRFARDLHDVLGRNLSLIAVKAELAAQLARRGDEEAAGHMLEVRRVAHQSLREMREVVSGYRTAGLDSELAGAQAVLRSAGVSCRILGDAAGLSAEVQAALGWVVREGTTNIIRHSDATACTIGLRVLDAPGTARTVTLRIDNDGVRPVDGGAPGSGLRGLGERLAVLGGTITARCPRSGQFRLEATLPASGTAAAPPAPGQASTGVTTTGPAP
jgi:two-component system, NarL family, sensor histidine kinase DesK